MALFDEDAPLRLCKHQLEHEGGRFWCNLPIGHAGPHEPPPHEAEGYSVQKRQRAPPKRLSDDVPEPKEKRPRLKPKSDTEDHARSDSDDAGSGGGGGATPLHRSHKKKAASRSGAGSRQYNLTRSPSASSRRSRKTTASSTVPQPHLRASKASGRNANCRLASAPGCQLDGNRALFCMFR